MTKKTFKDYLKETNPQRLHEMTITWRNLYNDDNKLQINEKSWDEIEKVEKHLVEVFKVNRQSIATSITERSTYLQPEIEFKYIDKKETIVKMMNSVKTLIKNLTLNIFKNY